MNKFFNRVKLLVLGLVLTFAGAVPALKAFATTPHGEGDYGITVGVDENADWVAQLTVEEDIWTSDDDEWLTEDGKYFLTIELHVPNDSVKENTSVRTSGDVSEYFEIRSAGESEDLHNGKTKFTFTANFDMPAPAHQRLSLFPFSEDEHHDDEHHDDEPAVEGDLVAHLLISCEETGEARCDDTSFTINDGRPEPYRGKDEDIEYHYAGSEDDEEITLRVESLWHQKFTYLLVNDEEIDISGFIDYNDQKSYLDHYDHQIVSFEFSVPKAADDVYNIATTVAINESKHIGNFLWTADPDQKDREDYIGNSSLSLVEISFVLEDIKYSCNSDTGECSESDAETGEMYLGCNLYEDDSCGIPYVEFDTDDELGFEEGALVIPAGARITMRVIPDYGYQVLNVNMSELETNDDGVGEFTFTVPAGAAYFKADVTKLDDEVAIDSEKVASGTVDLGKKQTTLSRGTARLEVEDVELSEETQEKFAGIAQEDGYEVKNYLNISLYNILYKGTKTDAWEEQIKDLNEPATITLQLEDGVDGNEIVIVHEKHDGTYEIIEATYDPEAQTLTFTTSSFSNYAIAAKTVASPETGVPTRDSSSAEETYYALSVISVLVVLSFAFLLRRLISR